MARPKKRGIDYFSFDVEFFSDVKIRKIARACGASSTSILICLLCNIYKDNGYYILWDEDLPFVIADTVGVSEGAVKEVMLKALQVGFFDESLYEKYKILTSKGIQNRFKSAVYKREKVEYISDYLISDVKNAVSDDGSTQRKGKERKGKKINIESKDSLDEFSFEHAWELYEKKGTSKVARRRWDNLTKAKKQLALRHIPFYVAATPVKQYRKNFETYLNQEAWNDEILIPTDPRDENLGVGVWVENDKKYYGERSSPIEIPMNAPFRPGKQYAYDREKNNWTVL